MKDKDARDDIWVSTLEGKWYFIVAIGLGALTGVFFTRAIGWMIIHFPILAAPLFLAAVAGGFVWILHKTSSPSHRPAKTAEPAYKPSDAPNLMPVDLDEELRLFLEKHGDESGNSV